MGGPRHSLPFSLALGLLACSSTPAPPPKAAVARPADSGPAFETPARWAAFPQTVGLALSTLVLSDGRCLVTTDDGQRWMVTPKDKKKPCAGPASASGSPSFEPLVGAQQVGDEFRFVAEGGLVYTSREPSGPFTKFSRAPVALKRVATVGNAIVGVDGDGGTHFFDGAWKASAVPAGTRGIDVGIDREGRVLWLGAPEAVMLSSDFGRTFKPITTAPRVGAYEVGFTQKGELAARGALGNAVLDGDRLTFTRERLRETEGEDVEIEPAEGPKASLLVAQRATLFGASYAEIVEPYDGARYGLGRSPLGAPFERESLALFDACDNVKLAAAGSALAVACLKQMDDKPNLAAELWLARDGKVASFTKITSLVTPSFNDVSFSLAADGSMLVLGACKEAPPPAAPQAEPAAPAAKITKPKASGRASIELPDLCSPKNPILVRGDNVTVGQSQNLEDNSARSPLLSLDGHAAYFMGRSRKDSKPAVFVSKDGGKTYQIRVIEPPQTGSWDDDAAADEEGNQPRPFYVPEQSTLTIDETGTLGLAGERDMGFSWVTLDGEGRVANVADPPEPSMTLGGAGNRVIALAYGQMDGVLRSWESLDGGGSWSEITTTQAVVRYGERGSGVVSCAIGGCLLGEELVRIGWEGQVETAFTMNEEPMPDPIDVKLGAGIACQLSPKSSWVEIEGRPEERVAGSSYSTTPAMPRLRDIMRGKTAFSVATVSVEDQSVEMISAAVSDKEAPVTKKGLLGPAKTDANGFAATLLRWQSEGFVALRAKVPTTKVGAVDSSKKIDLEVVWQNQHLGVAGRKSLKLETAWTQAFASGTTLRPSLLQVTGQGVVLQVQNNQRVVFADGKGQTSYELPSLQALLTDTRPVGAVDTAIVGGNLFATTFADRNPTATVFLSAPAAVGAKPKKDAKPDATKANGDRRPDGEAFAQSIAPSNAESDWLFNAEKLGVMTFTSATTSAPAKATGFMLDDKGKLGEAAELPTLRDLPDRPKPCSSEQRTTPRVPSPHYARSGLLFQGEGRHPVVVSEAPATATASLITATAPLDPIWLLTDGAILHGTKNEPCVAGYRASGLRPGTVAVMGGDLERSYLLRVQSGLRKRKDKNAPPQWGQYLQARAMSCRWQADLAVPVEVSSRASQRLGDDQP